MVPTAVLTVHVVALNIWAGHQQFGNCRCLTTRACLTTGLATPLVPTATRRPAPAARCSAVAVHVEHGNGLSEHNLPTTSRCTAAVAAPPCWVGWLPSLHTGVDHSSVGVAANRKAGGGHPPAAPNPGAVHAAAAGAGCGVAAPGEGLLLYADCGESPAGLFTSPPTSAAWLPC